MIGDHVIYAIMMLRISFFLIRAVRDLDLKVICNNIGLWTPNIAFFLLALNFYSI